MPPKYLVQLSITQGRHGEFEPGKSQYSTPNFFDQLFLIRAHLNPKSRQGPGLGGLASRGGPADLKLPGKEPSLFSPFGSLEMGHMLRIEWKNCTKKGMDVPRSLLVLGKVGICKSHKGTQAPL